MIFNGIFLFTWVFCKMPDFPITPRQMDYFVDIIISTLNAIDLKNVMMWNEISIYERPELNAVRIWSFCSKIQGVSYEQPVVVGVRASMIRRKGDARIDRY